MKLTRKYYILMLVAGLGLALDQWTKIMILANFQYGETYPVIQDIFHFTYVRNPGAAFGVFRDFPELFRKAFFLTLPPIAMIVIISILRTVEENDLWQIFALSLIFGGAFGNYIDRIRFGYVVDFLDFHYKNVWSYPAFNIADSCIVCGIGILLVLMFVRDRKNKNGNQVSKI